ncbi:MAG: hypothetical protein M3282_04295, partial [Gemmatimonadota bacterium]|nr:hypothetical protein [Gemmatimonadota bacterium]
MNALVDRAPDLVATATRFCRALRDAGLPVTPAEAIEAARVLEFVDLKDREELRQGLRGVLTSRPEDFQLFDELFEHFWAWDPGMPSRAPHSREQPTPITRPKSAPTVARWMRTEPDGLDEQPLAVARQSEVERLHVKDFAAFAPDELD